MAVFRVCERMDRNQFIGSFSGFRIEHPRVKGVKSGVNRVRTFCALLLPTLILIALPSLAIERSSCPGHYLGSSFSACGGCDHASSEFVRSFDQSARRSNRRFNDQSAPEESPRLDAPDQFPLLTLELDTRFTIVPLASLELANSWQFQWRTALAPRAPSSVS